MRFSTILSFVVATFLNFSFSQINGQGFTTTRGGLWEDVGVWSAATFPVSTNSSSITVNHAVSINANITLDQLTIGAAGSITIASGVTVTIANGTGDDITNFGQLIINGNLVFEDGVTHSGLTASNAIFNAGSSYEHRFTSAQGVLPLASWNSNSTLKITGYTNFAAGTPAGNWGQTFGNVEWNCPSQTVEVNMFGNLRTITGDLRVLNTGSSRLMLAVGNSSAAVINYTVSKSVIISGSASVGFSNGNPITLSVGESIVHNSNQASWIVTTGLATINLGQDLRLTNTGNFGLGNQNTARTILNLGGSIFITSSGELRSSNALTTINLNNGSTHVVSVATGESFDGVYAYNVGVNDILDISAGSFVYGGVGVSTVSSFSLHGTVIVRDTDNISAIRPTTTINAGAIRIAERTFHPGSKIILRGSGVQTIGGGFPSVAGLDVLVDNSSGVNISLSAPAAFLSNVIVSNGKLNINRTWTINGEVTIENGGILDVTGSTTARVLTLGGNLNIDDGGSLILSSGASSDATLTLQASVGGDGVISTVGPNAVINVTGATSISATLPVQNGAILKSLTINRTSGMIRLVNPVTISSALSITGVDLAASGDLTVNNLTLGNSSRLIFDEVTLNLQGAITNSGGFLYSNNGSLNITGNAALGNLNFSDEGMFLNSLTLNRSNAGNTLTLQTPLFIMGSLYIRDGIFNNNSSLFLESSEVRINSDGGFAGLPPEDGFYNLIYEGTSSYTTGPEAQMPVYSLTQSNSSTVNLGSNVEVYDATYISAGTFNQQNYSITTRSFNNEGTFNGSALGSLKVKNGFLNAGTFNHNSGLVEIDGALELEMVSPADFNNLTITPNGSLDAPVQLSLVGSLTNNGVFSHNNGKVIFGGTVVQYIQGAESITFNNLDINNTHPQGVQVQSDHAMAGILTLGANAVFDPDGSSNNSVFTLLSLNDSPAQDAAVAAIPAGASIIGKMTVQRYMSIEGTNGNLYRYISSPIAAATVEDIQNEIPVSGTFSGASVCSSCNANASLFWFDETGVQSLPNGYVAFPKTNNTETFEPGRGYSLFVRGGLLNTNVWDLRGDVNQGTIALPVSYTNSGHASGNGWNLVGNPYPSAIDWNSSGWTKSNLSGSIYVKDNGSGQFASWNGVVGTNGGSRYIALGQAFWVQSVDSSPSLIIEETAKAPSASTEFYRTSPLTNILRAVVEKGNVTDETIIHFRNEASNDFDPMHDARKMQNTGMFNLSSRLANGDLLSINSLQQLSCRQELPLNFSGAARGNYVFKFEEVESFDSDVSILLKDKFLEKEIDIRTTRSYSFDVTTNTSSVGGDRFVIVIDPNGVNRASHEIASNESCVGGEAEIRIINSQVNVNYSAIIDGEGVSSVLQGNGGELVLQVDPSRLILGTNDIVILTENNLCNTQETLSSKIVVKSHPTLLLQELNGEFVADQGYNNYVWYFNDLIIEGETSNSIEPKNPGLYSVVASMANGCSASANREKIITSSEVLVEDRVHIYPNPVSYNISQLTIVLDGKMASNFSDLSIVDQLGRNMPISYERNNKNIVVDMRNLPAGLYLVRISNPEGIYSTKIIKE